MRIFSTSWPTQTRTVHCITVWGTRTPLMMMLQIMESYFYRRNRRLYLKPLTLHVIKSRGGGRVGERWVFPDVTKRYNFEVQRLSVALINC